MLINSYRFYNLLKIIIKAQKKQNTILVFCLVQFDYKYLFFHLIRISIYVQKPPFQATRIRTHRYAKYLSLQARSRIPIQLPQPTAGRPKPQRAGCERVSVTGLEIPCIRMLARSGLVIHFRQRFLITCHQFGALDAHVDQLRFPAVDQEECALPEVELL